MDTYCEQLVKIKKGASFFLAVFGIWLVVLVVAFLSLIFLRVLSAIIIVGAGYGAYYLCGFLSIECEYIVTNGTFDIDIIYSKRSRKRIASFELSDVESIEKYKGEQFDKRRYKNITVACNKGDPEAYKLVINNDSGVSVAVISPDERTKSEIIKFVPKFVGNTAFRD
ncbi:MAG: hypothetical protein J5852_08975 [Clostridia bacterium]|nr:hypothetical protein [Clostridia bacterium]